MSGREVVAYLRAMEGTFAVQRAWFATDLEHLAAAVGDLLTPVVKRFVRAWPAA